ncbi:uncharacterized protein LACBIDRAFT_309652 [Laccaria bicolor S238N-H82]|uniref:Predicted protein n=1 Tax=Laccaria bicolor (strain S238N-H82 / ATCC MYA-4686) TaxID=486041 RepID=B0DSR9_LACBS|nr:uncharacterized protein LACBIDRAFT_309652 [Laccaria bicolor S238N-H82]EDR02287.1 predicted protein [Laccaria bicolor S238N-H82]|eukprot:XP_001886964.1 predicted protein [Laccaria bicolor S238N-H82]
MQCFPVQCPQRRMFSRSPGTTLNVQIILSESKTKDSQRLFPYLRPQKHDRLCKMGVPFKCPIGRAASHRVIGSTFFRPRY